MPKGARRSALTAVGSAETAPGICNNRKDKKKKKQRDKTENVIMLAPKKWALHSSPWLPTPSTGGSESHRAPAAAAAAPAQWGRNCSKIVQSMQANFEK